MSEQTDSTWGEMVLPGVYMLRRNTTSIEKKFIGLNTGKAQFEILLRDIEAIERHIEKLKQSNLEIQEYIKEAECDNESINLPSNSGDVIVACELDKENDILREALVENQALISSKEKELEELKRLVQANRCACKYHLSNVTNEVPPVSDDANEDEVEEEEEEEEEEGLEEISNARFCL